MVPPLIADNPTLAALWTYWRERRGGRRMPRRRDIDPVHIPKLLPYLQLVERIEPERRFRYRLTGSAIVEAYGRELTGKFIDEVIPPERRRVAEGHYSLVFDTCRPIYVQNKYTSTKSVDIVATRIILPLSENDAAVSMLIMAQTFDYGSVLRGSLDGDSTIAPYLGQVAFLEAEELPAQRMGSNAPRSSM